MVVNISDNFVVNPSLKIDHVRLKVSILQTSIDFYQTILGLSLLRVSSDGNTAYLGIESTQGELSTLLVLDQIDQPGIIPNISKNRTEAGLYHFAILLPERKYLASFLYYIKDNLDPQFYEGMADHAVSESIYLHDPDHNGIEVYRDRKPSEWKWIGEHMVYMATEPLDVANLLSQHRDQTWSGFPTNTTIGHVHLHASNLGKAKKFYNQLLGLYHTASYPGAYFFAANSYHHHIATNTWIGTNILPSNADDHRKPGLKHYAIRVTGDNEELNRLKRQLTTNNIAIYEHVRDSDEQSDTSFYIYDSDGIKIQILLRND
ncbi:MAG: VOC family protein [Candidatus Nitrosocosmicus sp.]|jgi:catechol 2,3-dioxygenase|uniref:VOC family protein n=1 Tax=Candidatus Nitrosocosmicus agrestis TaxID=2563600 RepID=UPI00122DE6E8|nr:VOC family protein [Candidatus Nitrosocosmicus sp. SS]KAA2283146.1 VOC family protein [Candidatus Nitrosocosmicus sp. SS]KAF0868602.1 VOC family protein [Candidatus Nitrosocosmicus sp. SS]MDR4490014.1 VOC family protein [Candidatus Nitrosocosmicus sp.]